RGGRRTAREPAAPAVGGTARARAPEPAEAPTAPRRDAAEGAGGAAERARRRGAAPPGGARRPRVGLGRVAPSVLPGRLAARPRHRGLVATRRGRAGVLDPAVAPPDADRRGARAGRRRGRPAVRTEPRPVAGGAVRRGPPRGHGADRTGRRRAAVHRGRLAH